jgi:hypothetical protein
MIVKSKSMRRSVFGAIMSVKMKLEKLEEYFDPFFLFRKIKGFILKTP